MNNSKVSCVRKFRNFTVAGDRIAFIADVNDASFRLDISKSLMVETFCKIIF